MIEWISVKDRLPEAKDGIIGATGEPEVVTICAFAHGWFPSINMVEAVREHPKYYRWWAPLPEPPGGEGE